MIKAQFLILVVFICMITTSTIHASETDAVDTQNQTLLWPDGTRYVGGVRDGKRWGKGTIFWSDGTRFVGSFANDLRNGPGTMILPDGSVYNGYFEDDTLVDTPTETIIASNVSENIVSNSDAQVILPNNSNTNHAAATSTSKTSKETQSPQPTVENKQVNLADNTVANNILNENKPIKPVAIPLNLDVTTLTPTVRDDIESMIKLWGAAWSDKNVVQYLDYYSDEFTVPGKQTRRQWETLRKKRLQRPKSISVTITLKDVEITSPNIAKVRFQQRYRSNLFNDNTSKQFILHKEAEFWRIVKEQSL